MTKQKQKKANAGMQIIHEPRFFRVMQIKFNDGKQKHKTGVSVATLVFLLGGRWMRDYITKTSRNSQNKILKVYIQCVFCVNKTKGCSFAFKKTTQEFS